jgi:transcriptional regulator with XRE-family HTH domain
MQFNEYIKSFRDRYGYTQEQLVQELYNNDEAFSGLDVVTLSRWERGISQPPVSKQVLIARVFETISESSLFVFNDHDPLSIEQSICKAGITNLVGKGGKKLVLNFLSNMIKVDDITIMHVRHAENIDHILQMPHALDKELTNNFSILGQEHFRSWACHPSNLFLVGEYRGQFLGMLFTLRLKPDVFERILSFEMEEQALSVDDFAAFDEPGCSYILSFFASNEHVASLLFLRYYAHLIALQKHTHDVGVLTIIDEGRKLVSRLHLEWCHEKHVEEGTISAHRAAIGKVLINPDVMKMIFQRQECPEESA